MVTLRILDDKRIAWITERYSAPDIRYFETPVVVHPDEGQIDNPGYWVTENGFGKSGYSFYGAVGGTILQFIV